MREDTEETIPGESTQRKLYHERVHREKVTRPCEYTEETIYHERVHRGNYTMREYTEETIP